MLPPEVELAAGVESSSKTESPAPAPAAAPTSAPTAAGDSNDKGKGHAKHNRHASLDGNEPLSQHKRTISPLPFISVQKKRRAVSLAPKYHPDERTSSDTISSRLSSQSTSSSSSSAGATTSSMTAPTEPDVASKDDKVTDLPLPSHGNEENGVSSHAVVKERPRKAGHRCMSPRGHLSPRRHMSPLGRANNVLDYMVQDAEEPIRYNPYSPNGTHGRPVDDRRYRSRSPTTTHHTLPSEFSIDEAFDPRSLPPIQTHQPNFPHPYSSPETPYIPGEGAAAAVFSPHAAHPPSSFPLQQPGLPNYSSSQVERLPLSGYELLAAKLSGNLAGPRLAPLYRRFETLHHRLLLHMQDELAELEEQLRSIDAADTQSRRFPGGVYPASRRQENLSPSEATWKKKQIVSEIAQKLYQYNQVISSFKETRDLAEPALSEIYGYRAYLSALNPLAEEESQFIEAADDLVDLSSRRRRRSPYDPPPPPPNDPLTPMPRSAGMIGFPPPPPSSRGGSEVGSTRSSFRRSSGRTEQRLHSRPQHSPAPLPPPQAPLAHLVLAVAVMILVPVLSFAAIPGFAGRMTVVLLVGLGVGAALLQSGLLDTLAGNRSSLDLVICAGVYGAVMAVVAGTFS